MGAASIWRPSGARARIVPSTLGSVLDWLKNRQAAWDLHLTDPVLVADVGHELALLEPIEGCAQRHLDHAGVAANLDRAGDGRAVHHLGDLHPEELGRSLQPVVGRAVQ